MAGLPVRLDRAPFSARLLLWGRAGDGWWGLVAWAQTVRRADGLDSMPFAAWLPARALSRPNWSAAPGAEVVRIALPGDRRDWPSPAAGTQWTGWFAGAWDSGSIRVPDGVAIVTGPAWRAR